MLNVPTKLVLNTLSGLFFDSSIAGSAQQSIIKSTLGKEFMQIRFSILHLKFLILLLINLLSFNSEPLRIKLSKL